MAAKYNPRSSAVKRIMQEIKELEAPTEHYHAAPLEDNIFEWHFTVRGPTDSDFEGGIYHGRIMLPPEYPLKPPSIMLLTPNGRFETGVKICLSVSSYHPESWQPSWSIRTVLVALIGFFPTPGNGSVAALDYPKEERKKLALRSVAWHCAQCERSNKDVLLESSGAQPSSLDQEAAGKLCFVAESASASAAATPVRPTTEGSADSVSTSPPDPLVPAQSPAPLPSAALEQQDPAPSSPHSPPLSNTQQPAEATVAAATSLAAGAATPASPPAPFVSAPVVPAKKKSDLGFFVLVISILIAIAALLVRARQRDAS